jgi:hypothetical protein
MLKVLRHGNTIEVQNPVTGEWNQMINVTFIEEGRGGADKAMSETTKFLADITGDAGVGLNQVRIHTHPIMSDKIGLFEIDKEFPGHINRGLFSTPQIQQQVDKPARIVDGKPTYFKTWISEKAEDDQDLRVDNNVLLASNPAKLFQSQVGAANVRVFETAGEAGRAGNPAGFTANQSGMAPTREFVRGAAGQSGRTVGQPQGGVNVDSPNEGARAGA